MWLTGNIDISLLPYKYREYFMYPGTFYPIKIAIQNNDMDMLKFLTYIYPFQMSKNNEFSYIVGKYGTVKIYEYMLNWINNFITDNEFTTKVCCHALFNNNDDLYNYCLHQKYPNIDFESIAYELLSKNSEKFFQIVPNIDPLSFRKRYTIKKDKYKIILHTFNPKFYKYVDFCISIGIELTPDINYNPIIMAIDNGRVDMIDAFLPYCESKHMKSYMKCAIRNHNIDICIRFCNSELIPLKNYTSLMYVAIECKNLDVIPHLLMYCNTNEKITKPGVYYGCTPLIMAIRKRFISAAELLLYTCDVNSRCVFGKTALMYEIFHTSCEHNRKLSSFGIKLYNMSDLSLKDNMDNTANDYLFLYNISQDVNL